VEKVVGELIGLALLMAGVLGSYLSAKDISTVNESYTTGPFLTRSAYLWQMALGIYGFIFCSALVVVGVVFLAGREGHWPYSRVL